MSKVPPNGRTKRISSIVMVPVSNTQTVSLTISYIWWDILHTVVPYNYYPHISTLCILYQYSKWNPARISNLLGVVLNLVLYLQLQEGRICFPAPITEGLTRSHVPFLKRSLMDVRMVPLFIIHRATWFHCTSSECLMLLWIWQGKKGTRLRGYLLTWTQRGLIMLLDSWIKE